MFAARDILVLTDEEVCDAFDWSGAIAALREAYAAPISPAQFPDRTMARGEGVWLRTLSGIMPGQAIIGAKMIAASTASKHASYLISLFDGQTMELIALVDGNAITGFRTAATSALAARALLREARPRIAVIGSGFEARNHIEAMARSGALANVAVFSPRDTSRQAFCEAMAAKGIAVRPTVSAQDAVVGADLVICAARSRDESPTIRGEWLRPGMTVVSIGSTLPEQRELDPEAIGKADLIVADMVDEVAHDTGDMIAATEVGIDFAPKLVSLSDVISGSHPGRTDADQIMLYKSVGGAIQDLAVAAMCVERARSAGIGKTIPPLIRPVNKGK